MSRKKKRNGNGENGNEEILNEIKEEIKPIKPKIIITAKTPHQKELLKSIKENIVTIVTGSPGSGKTYLSVTSALKEFLDKNYKKIIFTRPCVEANGESLGFLPGNLNDKIHPYMFPIFDFLMKYLSSKQIEELMRSEKMRTLPLAYQRGITFSDSFVLLDEAQNTSISQVRMFLTRIGNNCKVVITGDTEQSDIKGKNGLADAIERLEGVENLKIIKFDESDIMRNKIVAEIEKRYKD